MTQQFFPAQRNVSVQLCLPCKHERSPSSYLLPLIPVQCKGKIGPKADYFVSNPLDIVGASEEENVFSANTFLLKLHFLIRWAVFLPSSTSCLSFLCSLRQLIQLWCVLSASELACNQHVSWPADLTRSRPGRWSTVPGLCPAYAVRVPVWK